MLILHCRVVLRNHRSDCSDWRLYRWKILYCLCDSVFELLDWDLSGLNWLHCMHGMSSRLLLRYYGSHSSDGRLRSGLILGRLVNHVLELFSGYILDLCIFYKLLELFRGYIYVSNWHNRMHIMSSRVILRHNWSYCSCRSLRRGLIFINWNILLHKLHLGILFRSLGSVELHEFFGGKLFEHLGSVEVHEL